MLNVIVAGEESGVTRDEFSALGHNAWSCDLKPSRRPNGLHYQGSWRDICWNSFDLGIMHPECTHLAVSGARWFPEKRADGRQQAAIEEFLYLATTPVYASCLEQPISIMSRLYRKPDQIVQPWMFGEYETKATCYWLKNLPLLVPMFRTSEECREALGLPVGTKPHARVHLMAPGPDRAEKRSESYVGIAKAMAASGGCRMKRSSHRSSHAAVLGLQSFKGFQRVRISDHARNLPAAGRIGGLALCAGLWLRHGLARCGNELAQFGRDGVGAFLQVGGQPKRERFGAMVELARLAGGCLTRRFAPFGSVSAKLGFQSIGVRFLSGNTEREGGGFGGGKALHVADSDRGFGVHGWLRLVTVGPSLHVTSDDATTIRRERLPA